MKKWRNKISDVQHLSAHLLAKHDAFVTSDEDDMWKKRDLLTACGVVIKNPAEAVVLASAESLQSRPLTAPPDETDDTSETGTRPAERCSDTRRSSLRRFARRVFWRGLSQTISRLPITRCSSVGRPGCCPLRRQQLPRSGLAGERRLSDLR
jgi:hypothetical protein